MDIKLVASDLDGTIIDKHNEVSPKNFHAIQKIHNKKIKFVICTGKSYSVSQKICQMFNAQYGIFGNGNQIINLETNEVIWKKTLSYEDLQFIITFAKRFHYHCHVYSSFEVVTESFEFLDLRNLKLKNANSDDNVEYVVVPDILKYIEEKNLEVFSVVISTSKNTLKNFENILEINNNIDCTFISKRGKYRDNIINKDYEYLNITAKDVNKNTALKHLETILDIPSKNVLAIGDNINDLEMVKNAGIGIAVFDSYDELKQVAKFITTSSASNGAFSEAINKYIE